MSEREIGVEAARKRLGPLVDDAAVEGIVTFLTRRGRRFAAIVPLDRITETAVLGGLADVGTEGRVAELGAVDRDAVFEAVEELVVAVDVTTVAGSQIPDPLAEAIEEPAGRLVEAWTEASGDGPLTELVAAALAVVEAVTAHPGPIPPRLSATCATTRFALTAREENR